MVIALFRHGITEENKRKAYLGWNDSLLSHETKDLVTSKSYQRYYSSDLQRCVGTAEWLFPTANLHLVKELREMNFGSWEGKTFEDLKENSHYHHWVIDPWIHSPPGGESFHDFSKRVDSAWVKITEEVLILNLKSCAVITHGGVIRHLLSRFAPQPKEFWEWQVTHDQGYELIFEKESLRRGERCILLLEEPLTAKGNG
ncbi:histidine phosphatase family protein [Neobacillus drentensis]|uniref:histidine phosphatase family protein n=1 Tax=Neobacillus drentensis TaxID=220684 RepID=UPI0030024AA7